MWSQLCQGPLERDSDTKKCQAANVFVKIDSLSAEALGCREYLLGKTASEISNGSLEMDRSLQRAHPGMYLYTIFY